MPAAGLAPGTLPLWSGDDPDVWMMAADPAKAYGTGLSPRPLAETVRDTLAWIRSVPEPADAGLAPDRERELLAAWHALTADALTPATLASGCRVYMTMPRHISSEVPSPQVT